MKIIIKSPSNNYICSIIIGSKIYKEWLKYSFPFVKEYCKKNKIGLIIFNNSLIPKNNIYWKKPTWQKLLVGNFLKKNVKNVKNVCMLDVDILVNPNAPNIFDYHNKDKISVISLRKNLPYDWEKAVKNVSFYRNKYYSKHYPLDSAIGINLRNLYKMHNLKVQKDEFCAGVYIFNVKKFSEILKNWFFKYKKELFSVTGGGEQTHFNYEVQNIKKEHFIEYKFQAIWVFEMAINYPFLYKFKNRKNELITECILTSLQNNYFLHFAGSWYEGSMWKNSQLTKNYFESKKYKELKNFYKKKLSGKPKGMIKP